MDIANLISGVWDSVSPFLGSVLQAGALTAGAVEAGKIVAPSLVAGKEGDRSFQIPIVGAVVGKIIGLAPFVTMGWLPLLATAILAPFMAQGIHDVAAPYVDKVTKPIASKAMSPITRIVETAIAPFAKAFSGDGK